MEISVEAFRQLPAGTTVINAGRRAGPRELRGAIRYRPTDLLSAEHLALPISHDAPVVLYAEHGPSDELAQLAEKFRAEGFGDVRLLTCSLREAEAAGIATQEPSIEQVVPPHNAGEVQPLDRRI